MSEVTKAAVCEGPKAQHPFVLQNALSYTGTINIISSHLKRNETSRGKHFYKGVIYDLIVMKIYKLLQILCCTFRVAYTVTYVMILA